MHLLFTLFYYQTCLIPFLIILQKQKYLAENPECRPDGEGIGLDDDVYIVIPEKGTNKNKLGNTNSNNLTSTESLKEKQLKQSQGQKRRGRPRKDGENTKVADNKQVPKNRLKMVLNACVVKINVFAIRANIS